ncbi:MAG TPA: lysine--tRNA ligase [Dehalococcoidia bacterium]|nr:lysine--tRNA ligase [Dehalococcoidia bacterium]
MSDRLEKITQQRLDKLQRLRARGINPYPNSYHRTHTIGEAIALFEQAKAISTLRLTGRIVAHRNMGKVTFVDLQDGSGKIQAYFRSNEVGEEKYELVRDFDIGDFIGASGELFKTKSGETTLRVSDFAMLAKSLQPLPEKWHGLVDVEKRYRQRYLDLISNQAAKDIFLVRSRVITAMRRFLDSRGFIEVETPVLQPTAGGAMARPFVTHHNVLAQDLYLRIATELHLKRLVVGGFDKVYEIGRIFRNEGISTKHNPEFTTLESYEAYADYNDVMKMVEEMIYYIIQEVLGKTKLDYGGESLEFSPPWQRVTLREAIAERCGIDFEDYPDTDSLRARMLEKGIEVEPRKGRGKLIDELISTFAEPSLRQPTFVLDYPVELSPLAKRKPDNPRLVERFEAFAGGMEITNAFTELNDPIEQRERFQQQLKERETGDEETELPDEDFLTALEYGMPPTGGLGVGIDRLVMLLTNQSSIREVILFPQLKTKE